MASDEQRDSELDPYLSGKDGISGLYRRLGDEPPASLDQAIRAAARAPGAEKPSLSRRARYSIAASVLLCSAAVLLYVGNPPEVVQDANEVVQDVSRAPAQEPASEEARDTIVNEAARNTASESTEDTAGDAARNTASEAAQGTASDVSLEEITVTGSRIRQENFRASAEGWLERVQTLLDQGRVEEAETELARFRAEYPQVDTDALLDYPQQ